MEEPERTAGERRPPSTPPSPETEPSGLPELARRAGVRPVVAQGAVYRLMADGLAEKPYRAARWLTSGSRKALDADNRRRIAARLKNLSRTAYSQLGDVEAYANLKTCRREHLLRLLRRYGGSRPLRGLRRLPGRKERGGMPGAVRCTEPRYVEGNEPEDHGRSAMDSDLFERLRSWREEQARSQKVPAYVVLHNSHIEEISTRKPRTIHELGSIKGIGLRRAARYGEEILSLVHGEDISGEKSAEHPFISKEHLEAADRLLRSGRGCRGRTRAGPGPGTRWRRGPARLVDEIARKLVKQS